jgi:hypothetical protein
VDRPCDRGRQQCCVDDLVLTTDARRQRDQDPPDRADQQEQPDDAELAHHLEVQAVGVDERRRDLAALIPNELVGPGAAAMQGLGPELLHRGPPGVDTPVAAGVAEADP